LVDVALPSTVADMPLSFLMLLFAGCVIASNKWGRYFTILAGGEWALLGVRVLSFLIFVIVAWGAPVLRPEHSLVLGLFAFAAIEVIYLLFRTARFTPAVTPDNSSI